ncbi:MAG: thiamine pyrophosphate-binding protein [Alphaproteobacteria bacterium]|nr:MAG: thiamine pyrophosphate-binding protein [Alphaproteobacteria bacterium]
MLIRGSDLIAEFLEKKGVRHVFGIIGAGNAAIFDAIGRRGFTEIVCVHHEQAATMAMQTYFRMTGRPTVALLTTGGGSTNGITGVVSAWMDSMPGLIISGNEHSRHSRSDNPLRVWGVQGYDSSATVEKVTKYSGRISDPRDLGYELEKGWHITQTGRPGPVWLDIPMDIQSTPFDASNHRKYSSEPLPQGTDVESAAKRTVELIEKAARPVLWLGNGIRSAGAASLVKSFVEKFGAPTLLTWSGIDLVASDHPLHFGRAGVYGQRAANFVLQNADLVVAIGTRLAIPQIGYALDEFVRNGKLVVVDVDELEVHKHGDRVTLPVVADAGEFIRAMMAHTAPAPKPIWVQTCSGYRDRYPWVGPEHADDPPFINSYKFMQKLGEYMKHDQVIVTDMGTALLSGHQVIALGESQRMMTSTGLGEMGFGLPGAIGASFARDRGEVLCLNCDGGMMMNLQELQTVVHHNLPIKIIIFNNDGYLMIKHTQTNLYGGNSVGVSKTSGVSCPDYSKLATAFGFPAYQIRSWDDFDDVMPKVQAATGPVICEVFMHPMQLFVPKLSLARKADGSIVSPPIEDLSPLLPRDELQTNMLIGMHPKSKEL